MSLSKRSIPRVAAAGLLLGGGACDSSDDRPAPTDAAYEFCEALAVCGTVYAFDGSTINTAEYASLSDCRAKLSDQFAAATSDYTASHGISCGDAFLDFYDCYWDEYDDRCDPDDAMASCLGLYNEFTRACN